MKFTENKEFLGGSLQGYVDASYATLVEVFGEPHSDGDGYKVDAEWDLMFENGTHARIYNYKDGTNYNGSDGNAVEDITDWHVGGTTEDAVTVVHAALKAAGKQVRAKTGW